MNCIEDCSQFDLAMELLITNEYSYFFRTVKTKI